jgi:hypothetical protein
MALDSPQRCSAAFAPVTLRWTGPLGDAPTPPQATADSDDSRALQTSPEEM